MHVNLSMLIKQLSRFHSVAAYNIKPSIYVTGVEIFPSRYVPGETRLSEDKVYITEYRMLRLQEPSLKLPPMICVIEPGISVDEVFFKQRCVAVVYGGPVTDVLLSMSTLLYEYGLKTSELTEISHSFLGCRSMIDLLEKGYEVLRNPLILTDANQQILLFTDPQTVASEDYKMLVHLSHLPAGRPHQKEGFDAGAAFHLPQTADGKVPSGACMELQVKNKYVGYLHLIGFHKEVEESDFPILELLGNLLAVELWKAPHDSPIGSDTEREHFMREILDNTAGDDNDVLRMQQKNAFTFKKHIYAAVVQMRNEDGVPSESFHTIAKRLEKKLPTAFGFLYRNAAFLVLESDDEITDFNTYFENATELLQKNNLVVGVSNRFADITALRSYAFQSRKALQLGCRLTNDRMIYAFKDYAIYHMIEVCLRHERPDFFCSPELLRLQAAGRGNDNELFETLRVYLKCGRNKALTAREMFVHVNTIKYRMSQIQEIIGLDLDDDDNALKLMLSFKLLEYVDVFPNPEPVEKFWAP